MSTPSLEIPPSTEIPIVRVATLGLRLWVSYENSIYSLWENTGGELELLIQKKTTSTLRTQSPTFTVTTSTSRATRIPSSTLFLLNEQVVEIPDLRTLQAYPEEAREVLKHSIPLIRDNKVITMTPGFFDLLRLGPPYA